MEDYGVVGRPYIILDIDKEVDALLDIEDIKIEVRGYEKALAH